MLLPNAEDEVGAVNLTVLKPAPRQNADAVEPQLTVLAPEMTRVTPSAANPVVVPVVGQPDTSPPEPLPAAT